MGGWAQLWHSNMSIGLKCPHSQHLQLPMSLRPTSDDEDWRMGFKVVDEVGTVDDEVGIVDVGVPDRMVRTGRAVDVNFMCMKTSHS